MPTTVALPPEMVPVPTTKMNRVPLKAALVTIGKAASVIATAVLLTQTILRVVPPAVIVSPTPSAPDGHARRGVQIDGRTDRQGAGAVLVDTAGGAVEPQRQCADRCCRNAGADAAVDRATGHNQDRARDARDAGSAFVK